VGLFADRDRSRSGEPASSSQISLAFLEIAGPAEGRPCRGTQGLPPQRRDQNAIAALARQRQYRAVSGTDPLPSVSVGWHAQLTVKDRRQRRSGLIERQMGLQSMCAGGKPSGIIGGSSGTARRAKEGAIGRRPARARWRAASPTAAQDACNPRAWPRCGHQIAVGTTWRWGRGRGHELITAAAIDGGPRSRLCPRREPHTFSSPPRRGPRPATGPRFDGLVGSCDKPTV
jgi:hypothetical protein